MILMDTVGFLYHAIQINSCIPLKMGGRGKHTLHRVENASREFENGYSATEVIVYHEGTHSCTAVRPKPSKDEYLCSVLKENKH